MKRRHRRALNSSTNKVSSQSHRPQAVLGCDDAEPSAPRYVQSACTNGDRLTSFLAQMMESQGLVVVARQVEAHPGSQARSRASASPSHGPLCSRASSSATVAGVAFSLLLCSDCAPQGFVDGCSQPKHRLDRRGFEVPNLVDAPVALFCLAIIRQQLKVHDIGIRPNEGPHKAPSHCHADISLLT